MAYNSSFSPLGSTYLVGTSPVQVLPSTSIGATAYRVRNLNAASQYFTFVAPTATGGTPTITVTAPSAGVPSANTIGMLPNTIEVFGGLPPNCWFQASAAGAFEITVGEGM